MEKPASKNSFKNVLLRVLNFGIAITIGWYLGRLAVTGAYGIGFLQFIVFFALAIVVHELGHVLGALRVNFRVCSFTVGPITIRRNGGRTTIRWETLRIGGL